MKKRLGIFLFYNPSGRVHDYVTYLLNDISSCLEKLVIVCNGFINRDGREALGRFADELVVRPNVGFDFAAWKEGILDVCGMDEVRRYDELVLFNDSFFGPLYPFSTVFKKMDAQDDIDFWGLSSHGAAPQATAEDRPQYLQTYFLACRKGMVASEEFESYWANLEPCATFAEHANLIACRFTEHFEKLGYSWTAYCPTFDLESDDISKNVSHHMYDSYEMVARRGFPIIKRKTFTMPLRAFLRFSNVTTLWDTLDYIDKHTGYDTALIWDYLLKNCSVGDLAETLCLTKVLPQTYVTTPVSPAKDVGPKVAVIVHLYYPDLFESYVHMLQRVPSGIDLYVTVSSQEKKAVLEELTKGLGLDRCAVVLVSNQGRDLSALLVGCKDIVMRYDYVCFTHDKKTTHNQYAQQGRAFANALCEGMLASAEYVHNVIELFNSSPWLGLAVPPRPYHGEGFKGLASKYWMADYEQTVAVLSRLGIKVPMSKTSECLAVGSAFWFRTKALAPLFEEDWTIRDFPGEPLPTDGSISHGLERCFPFVAQSQGYATCRIMPESMARGIAQDYTYMLDTTVREVESNHQFKVVSDTFNDVLTSWGAFTSVYRLRTTKRVKRRVRSFVRGVLPFLRKLQNPFDKK